MPRHSLVNTRFSVLDLLVSVVLAAAYYSQIAPRISRAASVHEIHNMFVALLQPHNHYVLLDNFAFPLVHYVPSVCHA